MGTTKGEESIKENEFKKESKKAKRACDQNDLLKIR